MSAGPVASWRAPGWATRSVPSDGGVHHSRTAPVAALLVADVNGGPAHRVVPVVFCDDDAMPDQGAATGSGALVVVRSETLLTIEDLTLTLAEGRILADGILAVLAAVEAAGGVPVPGVLGGAR